MGAVFKGMISYHMLYVPVALHTATTDNDIKFNQLHKEDGSRIKYKKVCAHCGKEVASSDIVKGFEYEPGQYITLTEDDFEQAKTEKDKTIEIDQFTQLSSIRPIYYDKSYYIIPEAGAEKGYELLRRIMIEENLVGIAETVIGQSEKLLAIIPTHKGLIAETMYYQDEVKGLPKEPSVPELSDEEINMGKMLIKNGVGEFQPEKYHDNYQERLRTIIINKKEGKQTILAPSALPNNIISLQDALEASLKQQQGATAKPKSKPKTSTGTRRKKGA